MSESPASASRGAAAPGLAPVIDFLGQHAPFDRMSSEHREWFASRASVAFYAKGEVVLDREAGVVQRFYVIRQGRLRGETPESREGGEESAWELGPGECFPIGALLSRRAVHTVHRAVEDTFCFELDRADFEHLIAVSVVFHDFCTRRLASLLDQALAQTKSRAASRVSGEHAFARPLRELLERPPVVCAPADSARLAARRMRQERVGSVVVVDAEERPIGVFTLHDLLSRVIDAAVDLDVPLGEVMTPQPIFLTADAPAHEAAAMMAAHAVGHLCVVQEGRLVGVLSERDLFSLQRIGIVHLSRAIQHAPDVAALVRLERSVHRLADQMLAQGASIAQLTKLIAELNDHLTRRVLALVEATHGAPSVPYTWLAFGSEGRHEQLLKTDQDNGIVFRVAPGTSADSARGPLLAFARVVNEALAQVGFPLCRGQVMASNPDCCLSFEEWQSRFDTWIAQGSPEDLLKMSIFFDFRALRGDAGVVEELRREVLTRAAATPRFLHQLAANALSNTPPLGWAQQLVVTKRGEHANTIDLKLRGAMPFVDGARLFALAHQRPETNTTARLRAVAAAGGLPAQEVEAWCDAYDYIQLRRMRVQQRQAARGEPLDNHLDPEVLNELDRRILKEAFRQARKLQARVGLDFRV